MMWMAPFYFHFHFHFHMRVKVKAVIQKNAEALTLPARASAARNATKCTREQGLLRLSESRQPDILGTQFDDSMS
jgi:hypothetical protein